MVTLFHCGQKVQPRTADRTAQPSCRDACRDFDATDVARAQLRDDGDVVLTVEEKLSTSSLSSDC